MNIAIVVSRFNEMVTQSLLNGAVEAFYARGGDPEDLEIIEVPGAFELPFVVGRLVEEGEWDGIVALGCILQGETDHHHHLASSVFHALAELNAWSEIPITQGILTVSTLEQALQRAGGKHGNKGREAMNALLDVLDLFEWEDVVDLDEGNGDLEEGADAHHADA